MYVCIHYTHNRETMYYVRLYNMHYTYVNIHDTCTKHMKEKFEV